MATYNGAGYLAEQLESLRVQTTTPLELVVTDDASSDDTVAVIRAFAETCGFPVRIEINPERLGYRRNFMKAASLCRGDVVLFCDQDDIWLPTKLAEVVAAFARDEVLFVYHNAEMFANDGTRLGLVFDDERQLRRVEPGNPNVFQIVRGCTQAYRTVLHAYDAFWPLSRDIWSPIVEPDAHDLWYPFLGVALGEAVYLPRALMLYRQHGANTSGQSENEKPTAARSLASLFQLFTGPVWNDRQCGEVALARAGILRRIADTGLEQHREVARTWAARYELIGRAYVDRAVVLHESSRSTRLAAWWRMVASGSYSLGRRWKLRLSWLPCDFLRAIGPAGFLAPERAGA